MKFGGGPTQSLFHSELATKAQISSLFTVIVEWTLWRTGSYEQKPRFYEDY